MSLALADCDGSIFFFFLVVYSLVSAQLWFIFDGVYVYVWVIRRYRLDVCHAREATEGPGKASAAFGSL